MHQVASFGGVHEIECYPVATVTDAQITKVKARYEESVAWRSSLRPFTHHIKSPSSQAEPSTLTGSTDGSKAACLLLGAHLRLQ